MTNFAYQLRGSFEDDFRRNLQNSFQRCLQIDSISLWARLWSHIFSRVPSWETLLETQREPPLVRQVQEEQRHD
jgi:hypothetical protein